MSQNKRVPNQVPTNKSRTRWRRTRPKWSPKSKSTWKWRQTSPKFMFQVKSLESSPQLRAKKNDMTIRRHWDIINIKLQLILFTLSVSSAESYLIVQKLHRVHLKLMLFRPHPLIERERETHRQTGREKVLFKLLSISQKPLCLHCLWDVSF